MTDAQQPVSTQEPSATGSPAAPKGLPSKLMVKSMVRTPESRLLRKKTPGKAHHFKNYLLGDRSLRLLRARPVVLTSSVILEHLDDFLCKEAAGMLAVYTLAGERVVLTSLREGVFSIRGKSSTYPLPNPPLDSVANDTPAGNALPQYLDGTFVGDPAAERALQRITAEKLMEAERQGAVILPPSLAEIESECTTSIAPEALDEVMVPEMPEALDEALTPEIPKAPPLPTAFEDPAAARNDKRFSGKRRSRR